MPRFRLNHIKMPALLKHLLLLATAGVTLQLSPLGSVYAQDLEYGINAGDLLHISIWKEPELSRDVLVRPDGRISFPLVGDISVGNKTPEQIVAILAEKISQFIPDAAIDVALIQLTGNRIYVLGKVNRPGEFLLKGDVDVMQALSMAGGLTPFAEEKNIRILRRDQTSKQAAIPFQYNAVKSGLALDTNILLKSGDTVVVP